MASRRIRQLQSQVVGGVASAAGGAGGAAIAAAPRAAGRLSTVAAVSTSGGGLRAGRGHAMAAGAAHVDGGDGVPIAGLRITQGSLRTAAQMTDLIEHVATGGDWSEAETAVQLVRFEDGELFLRDGHHRCVATLAAGRRAHLLPSEYVLEEWRYEQWSRPNLSLRPPFITPYDPR
eukprot:COSAG01_NODE_18348_length_1082_cov_2.100712_1_plen_175_part_10